VAEASVHEAVAREGGPSFLLGAEVPVEDQGLSLRVTGDPFAVATELGIVGRQELEPGQGSLPELVEDAPITEDALHLPVRGERAEVHDADVPLRRLRLLLKLVRRRDHCDSSGSGCGDKRA
jgi:hypothetical protein